MREMPELKSCPFCGETPEQPVDATRILGVWRIIHRCRVIPPFAIEGATPECAIAAWNARADTPLTPAEAMERCPEVAALVAFARQSYEDELWNAYHTGHEREDGKWHDCCIGTGEWLVRELELDQSAINHDAAMVKAIISKAVPAALAPFTKGSDG